MFLVWAFAKMTAEEILYQINNNKYERGAVAARQQQLQTALEEVQEISRSTQQSIDACKEIKRNLEKSLDENREANGFKGDIQRDLTGKGQAAISEIQKMISSMDRQADALIDLENWLNDEIRGSETMLRRVAGWLEDAWDWYRKLTNN